MESLYSTLILYFVLLVGVPFLLNKISKGKVPTEDGWKILKPPKELLFLGFGGILLSSLIFFIDLGLTVRDIVMALFLIFFFLAGTYFVVWYYRCILYFNDVKIKFRHTFGGFIEMNWSDIKGVKYSKLMDRLILSDSKNKISVDIQFSGYLGFTNFLKKKLPEECYSEALKTDKSLRSKRGYNSYDN